MRGAAAAAALKRGRGGAQQGLEKRRAAGSPKLERYQAAVFGRVLGFLMGLGLAWATQAPSRPTWSAKSTTSRLEKSSRQLVDRLA
jgi:hypothetical protein